mmetsp:Transcript_16666/g.50299  ORF Transcript_16666/g.50299 Transcript_16666/m.50299 type:complete len:137 (+) Transcript_16666:2512-2922(+)
MSAFSIYLSISNKNLGKAALAILLTLLKSDGEVSYNRCENTKIYVQNFPQMFPLLQTCLEDFDTSMRELAMSGLVCLLELLPRGSLDQRDAHALYPGIIKRLDDSINAVRRDACRAFIGYVNKRRSHGTTLRSLVG